MKRVNRSYTLWALLVTALMLGGCTLTLPGQSSESGGGAQPPETELSAGLEVLNRSTGWPPTLRTGEPVNLRFTLINNTETNLYVLTWYTPLEGIAGEIFRVERDGQAVSYTGPLATRRDPSPDDYTLLHPGKPVSADVDLATVYDFSTAGEYTIHFMSPMISHVARTEADMAETMHDLGPVKIPSSEVIIRVASQSD